MKIKAKKLYLLIAGKDIIVKNAPSFSDNVRDKQNTIIPLIGAQIRQDKNNGSIKAELTDGNSYKLNWFIE